MKNEDLNTLTMDDVNAVLQNHALPTFTNRSFDVALARVGEIKLRQGLLDLGRNARAVHFFWYRVIRDSLATALRAESEGNHWEADEDSNRVRSGGQDADRQPLTIQSVANDIRPVGRHQGRAVSAIHGRGQHQRDVVFACRMELRPVLVNGAPVSFGNKQAETLVMEGLLRVAS